WQSLASFARSPPHRRRLLDPVQRERRELTRDFVVARGKPQVEEILTHRVMHRHGDEEQDGRGGVAFPECAFLRALLEVCPKKLESRPALPLVEKVGQGVAIQPGKQQQAVERSILAERFENLSDEAADQRRVVAPGGQLAHLIQPRFRAAVLLLFIQNGAIKIFFGGEMPEQDRLADAAGRGDVFGPGATESVAGKKADRAADQLSPAPLWSV